MFPAFTEFIIYFWIQVLNLRVLHGSCFHGIYNLFLDTGIKQVVIQTSIELQLEFSVGKDNLPRVYNQGTNVAWNHREESLPEKVMYTMRFERE